MIATFTLHATGQKVSAELKETSKYKVILFGGVDISNAGEYGLNKVLAEHIVNGALSEKYKIPLKKGDVVIVNSPLFGKQYNGKDVYNDILKIIRKDGFDIENGNLILYGYSFGGQILLNFLEDFKKDRINISLLITIDTAKSLVGFSVNNDITDNVKYNLNIYQRVPSKIGSRGDKNEGNNVKNINLTGEKNSKGEEIVHSNIDDYTLLYCTQVILYALKDIYSFYRYDEETIKKQIKQYASQRV